MTGAHFPTDMREETAAAVLSLLGAGALDGPALRKARARLLRIGIDMNGQAPPEELAGMFQEIMLPGVSFDALWPKVQAVRTFREQAAAYLDALNQGTPSTGYEDFEKEAPEEWRVLRQAFTSERARGQILVVSKLVEACPHCHMRLPLDERRKLQSLHVATCRSCGRIIIYRE
jgi:hypothetical protein